MKKRQVKKLIRKIEYATGPTGYGPVNWLDSIRKPPPKMGRKEKEKSRIAIREISKLKQDCFRQSCIEVLGEDPNDW